LFPHESIDVVLDTLVNPERPIPTVVTNITGITQRDVRNKPTFGEIVDDVMGALAGRVFVAHNMRFDWGFHPAGPGRDPGRSSTLHGATLQALDPGPQIAEARQRRDLFRDRDREPPPRR